MLRRGGKGGGRCRTGRRSNKRGYLKEDFRLFHLKDSRAQKVDYHYHAFDKLILLLGGKVTYVVEGVTYFLQPWDLLLVRTRPDPPAHHRPGGAL